MRFDHYFSQVDGRWYAVSLVYNDSPNAEYGDRGWYVVLENLHTGNQGWSSCYFEDLCSASLDFRYATSLNPLIYF